MVLKGRIPAAFRWCFIMHINNKPPSLRAGNTVWKKVLRAESERPCVPACYCGGHFASLYITPTYKITLLILNSHREIAQLLSVNKREWGGLHVCPTIISAG